MQIANPIYDTVFKFLMEDKESAILLLSTIIGEEITSLDFLPQENTILLEKHFLTVYRLDFSAKVKTASGYKQLLIEIQKAKFAADIMRFRRYLGEQYSKRENTYIEIVDGQEVKKALPIVSIYFLGYSLEHARIPVIKVNRHYYDVTKGNEITIKEDFIESLTHDSYVIQIPQLRESHQTDLEQLLTIFDQKQATPDYHILTIREDAYPEKYRPLIRRLQRAISEPEVRKTMDIEDDILEELQDMERQIANKDIVIEEKEKIIDEKEKIIDEKEKIIEELKKQLDKKNL
ncbi:MAG: hypothetical protein JXC36_05645 [Candidatus Atribacteria bacterium]|nr:hypothetical protein [Candidatus Atribacteria bacterium]